LKPDCSNEDFLINLVKKKLEEKIKEGKVPATKKGDYFDRLEFELGEITKLCFTDYILLVYYVLRFCKDNAILNGLGRGSSAGSLILYVLDIVKVDALKHDLLFERFISSARAEIKEINGEKYVLSDSLPDVDIDSDRALKHKVNEFLHEQFPGRCAAIANIGTFQGKLIIKEVLKVVEEASEEQAKYVSDLIENKFGKIEKISDALLENEKFKEWAVAHEESVAIARKLNGLNRNKSVHASGIIICNDPLEDILPLELSSDKKLVCGYTMYDAVQFGVKLDNLGLKNLGVIKDCLALVGKKMEDINVDDPSIYKFLNNSDDYYGIFQVSEGLGKYVLKQIKPQNINDIILAIAVGRPGSMNFLEDIIDGRDGKIVKEIDERVKEILLSTYNVIVFQEQIMALSRAMADFTPQEADGLRKGIGRKIKEKVLEYKDKFIKGAIKNGYKEEFVKDTFDTFEASGDYLFNRCMSPDTIIETEDGEKMMFEVGIGDKIKAYDIKKNKDVFVKVLAKYESKAELYEIELDNGYTIKSSLNHKYLCEDKKMRTLEEILVKKYKILTE